MRSIASMAIPWYLVGGIDRTKAVAAYQPKGAASLAASYVNLANPGTNDAAPGVAPTHSGATGWGFTGTQWLATGIVPTNDQTWSAVIRFSDAPGTASSPMATRGDTPFPVFGFNLTTFSVVANSGGNASFSGVMDGGSLAVAGGTAYKNGGDAKVMTVVSGTFPSLIVGGRNRTSSPEAFFTGNIQAIAIYNATLTAEQVAAVTAAMAAL